MRYKVYAGKLEKDFSSLKTAKTYARQFIFAQIVNSFNTVIFISRNYRIYKI